MLLPEGATINDVGSVAEPSYMQIIIRGLLTMSGGVTRTHINTFDFRRSSPFTAGGTKANAAADFWSTVGAAYKACISNSLTVMAVIAKYLDNPLDIPVAHAVEEQGDITTDRQPSFDAVYVKRRTGVPSQSFRGSIHVGALPESFTTLEFVNSTGQTAYDGLMTALNTVVSGGVDDGQNTWAPVIISRTLSDLTLTPSVFTSAPVIDYSYSLKVGSMVRRKKGSIQT